MPFNYTLTNVGLMYPKLSGAELDSSVTESEDSTRVPVMIEQVVSVDSVEPRIDVHVHIKKYTC